MLFCLGVDKVKKSSLAIALLMQPVFSQAESVNIASASLDDPTGLEHKKQQRSSQYPHWPASRQVNTVIVPPPPPGPYTSLALDDFSVNKPSFADDSMRSVSKLASTEVPMEVFSPDVSWPENLRPVKHWEPGNDYRYAPAPVIRQSYPGTQNSPSNYRQGYNRSTNMNWADSRGPYSYYPAIRPGYGKAPDTVPYPSVGQP